MSADISENEIPIVFIILMMLLVLMVRSPMLGSFQHGELPEDTVIKIVEQLNGKLARKLKNAAQGTEEESRNEKEVTLTSTMMEQKTVFLKGIHKEDEKTGITAAEEDQPPCEALEVGKLTLEDILLNEIPKMRPGRYVDLLILRSILSRINIILLTA